MAFYRCSSGGGTLKETVLWTNPNPSANFNSQNVTLSEDISNYDFIKFVWQNANSGSSGSQYYEDECMLVPTDYWLKSRSGNYYHKYALGGQGARRYFRLCYKGESGNIVHFDSAGSNDSSTYQAIKPLYIYGVKY